MKSVLFVLFLILNGYVLITEFHYYRGSVTTTGEVTNLHVTSSSERRLYNTCTRFRGREDCSTLYAYDVTWLAEGKSWHWHAEKERTAPGVQICMQVVQGNPRIAKPCASFFFINSRIPFLMMIWGILVFIAITYLIYRISVSLKRKRASLLMYRVCTTRRQQLLETDDPDEIRQFIGTQYRVCNTTRSSEILRRGRKKIRVECITYHVRIRKGP
ncbi:hypothetical protein [Phytobacter sp. V91]|uniref:hypothetical protein n=1 Tax=Phytobacter sp. V91 TaxID=3369425 RepID=UPI003F62813F